MGGLWLLQVLAAALGAAGADRSGILSQTMSHTRTILHQPSPLCLVCLQENEPDIFHAIKFGCILENVVFDEETRGVDYDASRITENTRASYPIEHIGEGGELVWGWVGGVMFVFGVVCFVVGARLGSLCCQL
jgi:hypothetical protein